MDLSGLNFDKIAKGTKSTGSSTSRTKGRGLDFDELREYQPGDEIRFIDWKVTARTTKPHTKVFVDEKCHGISVILELRNSAKTGTKKRLKSEVIKEVAEILIKIAKNNRDLTSINGIYKLGDPSKCLRLLNDPLTPEDSSDLPTLFKTFHLNKSNIIFVISDLNYQNNLIKEYIEVLPKNRTIVFIEIFDSGEVNPTFEGILPVVDPLSGEIYEIALDKKTNMEIADYYRQLWHEREQILGLRNFYYLKISTEEYPEDKIRALLD